MCDSIWYWYSNATKSDYSEGVNWYPKAHGYAAVLADEYNTDVERVCAILAVLSVGVRWATTLRYTSVSLDRYNRGEALKAPLYRRQLGKVASIMEASNLDALPDIIGRPYALKTRAFYDCILRPMQAQSVVIDRWMLHAIGNHYGRLGVKEYRRISGIVCKLAERLYMLPSQVQAITWCAIRNAYKGKWTKERT